MVDATETSVLEEPATFVIEPWHVILLNDDWHTFDEVIFQLIKATGYTIEMAGEIAWQAHLNGEAICYTGPKEHCEHVALVLEEIHLGVRLERAF